MTEKPDARETSLISFVNENTRDHFIASMPSIFIDVDRKECILYNVKNITYTKTFFHVCGICITDDPYALTPFDWGQLGNFGLRFFFYDINIHVKKKNTLFMTYEASEKSLYSSFFTRKEEYFDIFKCKIDIPFLEYYKIKDLYQSIAYYVMIKVQDAYCVLQMDITQNPMKVCKNTLLLFKHKDKDVCEQFFIKKVVQNGTC